VKRALDGSTRAGRAVLGAAGVLGTVALFELVIRAGLVSETALPPPTVLFARLGELALEADFWEALGATLFAWGLALGCAAVIAIPAGIAIGSFGAARRATEGVIELLRPIPSVALLPLAILLFGLGLQMKVTLAAYASTWPLLVNTIYGVGHADRLMLDTARSFGWSRAKVVRRVVLPSASPSIATGMRVAAAVSLIVVLSAEILAASSGLGELIRGYQQAGRPEFVYAGIVATGILGLVVNLGLTGVERRLLRWTPGYRDG
jgi:ABC-type nitrate/sulfonate/bicarbonate transport system permease component